MIMRNNFLYTLSLIVCFTNARLCGAWQAQSLETLYNACDNLTPSQKIIGVASLGALGYGCWKDYQLTAVKKVQDKTSKESGERYGVPNPKPLPGAAKDKYMQAVQQEPRLKGKRDLAFLVGLPGLWYAAGTQNMFYGGALVGASLYLYERLSIALFRPRTQNGAPSNWDAIELARKKESLALTLNWTVPAVIGSIGYLTLKPMQDCPQVAAVAVASTWLALSGKSSHDDATIKKLLWSTSALSLGYIGYNYLNSK